jgi:hypothetical protein
MIPRERPTEEEAVKAAGRAWAVTRVERDAMTPRECAEAAWYPYHPLGTVEAIEELIILRREQALAAREAEQIPPLAA